MRNLYHRLLLLIAGSTQKELAARIRYLKIENQILRSKLPDRVPITPVERSRLIRFGSKLAAKVLAELVTIVHPDTLRRWIREATQSRRKQPASKGRPRTRAEIRRVILRMARENDWGHTRILGELKKLDITPPSRNNRCRRFTTSAATRTSADCSSRIIARRRN
jgi:putative transposase